MQGICVKVYKIVKLLVFKEAKVIIMNSKIIGFSSTSLFDWIGQLLSIALMIALVILIVGVAILVVRKLKK